MDRMARFVAASGAFMVAAIVVLVALTGIAPSYAPSAPLLVPATIDAREASDEPMRLSMLDGEGPVATLASSPDGLRVILLKVPIEGLAEAAEANGRNTGQYALRHPHEPAMAILAYDAASTHLGCTVGLAPGPDHRLPSWLPGRQDTLGLMDPCHQGQWDVMAGAVNRPGTWAPRPLGVVPIALGPGMDPVILHTTPIEQDGAFDAYEAAPFRLAA